MSIGNRASTIYRNSYCGKNVWSVEFAWNPDDTNCWARSHFRWWIVAAFYFLLFMALGVVKRQDR